MVCHRIIAVSLAVLFAVGAAASVPEDTLGLVREMFPAAASVAAATGDPPAMAVRDGAGGLLGYAFHTVDILAIPAYSGKPIDSLVGLGTDGRIRGVEIVAHEEPILVIGLSDDDLHAFTRQYHGKTVERDIGIGGRSTSERQALDAISGATITVMVINRAVTVAARRVADSRGIPFVAGGPDTGHGAARAPPVPLWVENWRTKVPYIAGLAVGLAVLLFILLFQDWVARRARLLGALRTAFLLYTVLFIGVVAHGQLSVVNVLTFTHSLLGDFSWQSYLIDPVMFILWGFVAFTILLWGRGVYCGWLCPFGALQKLAFQAARYFRLPQWELPPVVHERLWALKYVLLIGLFGVSLHSLVLAQRLAEVEPFKTAFGLHFVRDWPFVVYAAGLLVLALFIPKPFCRYLCPLGAALTFPGRFRIFDWLRRRKECGRPCQICAIECEVGAIKPTGEIIDTECHHCLDCQVTYWNDRRCPPLVARRKKLEKLSRSGGADAGSVAGVGG